MVLRALYSILLGLFLALFVGIGISTFYPEHMYKTPTPCMTPASPDKTAPLIQSEQDCQKAQETLQSQREFYTQVVSSIALVAAVIYLGIAFIVFRNEPVFSFGFLFGSMFTLLYSVLRGFSSNHPAFTFVIVVISVIIVMSIGYLRFVKEGPQIKK